MSMINDLSALDLAALVSSRICHDIISPVGAITNGLEVLDDDGNEDMREFAMDLIRKSARQASAKLQFARLAFGAAGSAGSEIDLGDARSVAEGFLENEKADIEWNVPRLLMAKNKVKLLLKKGVLCRVVCDDRKKVPVGVKKSETWCHRNHKFIGDESSHAK